MRFLLLLGFFAPIVTSILLPNLQTKKNDNSMEVAAVGQALAVEKPAVAASNNNKPMYPLPFAWSALPPAGQSFPVKNIRAEQPATNTFDFKIGTVDNEVHSKPMVLPAPQVLPSTDKEGKNFVANMGPDSLVGIRLPQVQNLPIHLNSTKLLNDLFGNKNIQIQPAIMAADDSKGTVDATGTLPSFKDIITGKAGTITNDILINRKKPINFHIIEPQISPPYFEPNGTDSIVNPFIPPIPIHKPMIAAPPNVDVMPAKDNRKKNEKKDGKKKKEIQVPSWIKMPGPCLGPKVKPQLQSAIFSGSPVQNLLSNLTGECEATFVQLARNISELTINEFKERFNEWASDCGKEDIVNELENKTQSIQEAYRANLTALLTTLPLYVQGLENLEKNDSMTIKQKVAAVEQYMNNITDPNISKTLRFLNSLFWGDMITKALPGISGPSSSAVVGPSAPANTFRQYLSIKRQKQDKKKEKTIVKRSSQVAEFFVEAPDEEELEEMAEEEDLLSQEDEDDDVLFD